MSLRRINSQLKVQGYIDEEDDLVASPKKEAKKTEIKKDSQPAKQTKINHDESYNYALRDDMLPADEEDEALMRKRFLR